MISVRHEEAKDTAAIRFVHEQAFGSPNEGDLVEALRERGAVALSLVAIRDREIIGHILFSPVTVESENSNFKAIGLGPMAILPRYQRRGIGSQLVRLGLEECRQAVYEIVVVLGHPHFYSRFGFLPANSCGIEVEFDVPDDVFMVMELREGALKGRRGVVKYQPEFKSV